MTDTQVEAIITTPDLAKAVAWAVEKAETLKEQAERAVIDSPEIAGNAADFLKLCTGAMTKLETQRKELLKPYADRTKVINAEYKRVTVLLGEAKGSMSTKLLAYQQEERRKQREREAEERRKQEEANLAAAQKAEEEGDQATADAILDMAAAPKKEVAHGPARGGLTGATAAISGTWRGEVDNVVDICRAVAEGALPTSIIKVGSGDLNKLAREFGQEYEKANEKKDGAQVIRHGVKCTFTESIASR